MTIAPKHITPASPYGHSEYFAALDGFRGILALCVAIYHTIWLSHINSWTFFNNGAVIIDLFFAFSGFLMFRLYQNKIGNGAQAKTFMLRRFARLYPLHLFMLAVFVAFALLRLLAHKFGFAEHEAGEILPFMAGAVDGWGSLFSHLSLTHAMGVNDALTFNPPSWTISAEFFTYFVFVAMMLWARPKKNLHFVLLAIAIVEIYAILSQLKPSMDITYDLAFFRCIGGFFTGVIAAEIYTRLKSKVSALKETGRTLGLSLAEFAILLASTLFVIYCGGKGQFFVAPFILLFVVIFAFDGGFISRFMKHKIFAYLAKISYSVYMIHVIIAIAFGIAAEHLIGRVIPNWNISGWGGDALLVIYLSVVIFCSHLTYHFIEIPGGRFIHNWNKNKNVAVKTA